MNKLFCLLALALNIAFATHTLAILPSDGTLSDDELELLTDKMREAALNVLPVREFTLLKQDVVIKRLGGMDNYIKECSETSCIVNLGKKAQVDYVAQCRVGKLGNNLRITVELYEVSTGGLLGMFSDVADSFYKLPPMMESHIPAVFKNITAQRQRATEPQRQRQEATEPVVTPVVTPVATPIINSVVASNVWNNWVYGEFLFGFSASVAGSTNGLAGFGVRYERMLSSRISVGGGFHLGFPFGMSFDNQGSFSGSLYTTTVSTEEAVKENQDEIDGGYDFDINAFFRFYPWAGAFYLGAGFGYHNSSNYIYSDHIDYDYHIDYDSGFRGYYYSSGGTFYTAYKSGTAITPEMGWKIDVGEKGGFCINLGMSFPIIIGEATPDAAYSYDYDYSLTKTKGASDDEFTLEDFSKTPAITMLYYFSVGYAFSKQTLLTYNHIPDESKNITAQRQRATAPQRQEATEPVATPNLSKNRVYGEFLFGVGEAGIESSGFPGFGVRYERVLGSRISVGGGFYLGVTFNNDDDNEIRDISGNYSYNEALLEKINEDHKRIQDKIDAGYFYGINTFFRLYPWGGVIYLGTSFGYHHSTNYIYSASLNSPPDYGDVGGVFYTAYRSGITITPEMGLKIDIGDGFCVNLGMSVPVMNENEKATPDAAYFYDADYSVTKTKGAYASDDESLNNFAMAVFYFSVGYAF